MKFNKQYISISTDLLLLGIIATFEGVGATWWFLSQLQLSSVGAKIMCDNIPGLVRRQKYMCQRYPDVMLSVSKGAKMAVNECQNQFRNQRWNCSTVDRDASVFGKILLRIGSRESAFVYAITSAGIVHALTRSCSKGEIKNCVCDPTKTGRHRDKMGEFTWGGCSDFIRYGTIFAKKFVDASESNQRDARALMNLHNNRAGRKAVQKHVRLECKCHGVSGSCAVRTCWVALMDFRRVANYLKRRYDGAVQVMMSQSGTELIVANRNHKKPTGSDLVYFESSPDYCIRDNYTGSLGTGGRVCNKTSLGTSGCDIMCCGRGYDTKRELFVTKCNCRFQWCCFVKCEECKEWRDIHTCKPSPSVAAPAINSRDMRDIEPARARSSCFREQTHGDPRNSSWVQLDHPDEQLLTGNRTASRKRRRKKRWNRVEINW